MTGLVGHHVAQHLLEQRLGRHGMDEAEGGQGEPLHHDLHAEVGHVPTGIAHDVVEQEAEVGVHRVVAGELGVEVLGEDLDVACLVHRPGWRRSTWRRSTGTVSTIFAVHSSAPCSPCMNWESNQFWFSMPNFSHSLSPHVSSTVPGEVGRTPLHLVLVGLGVVHDDPLLIDLDRPVQVGLAVPLGLLGLLVELVQLGLGSLLVVPGELGRAVVRHSVEAFDRRSDRRNSARPRDRGSSRAR